MRLSEGWSIFPSWGEEASHSGAGSWRQSDDNCLRRRGDRSSLRRDQPPAVCATDIHVGVAAVRIERGAAIVSLHAGLAGHDRGSVVGTYASVDPFDRFEDQLA